VKSLLFFSDTGQRRLAFFGGIIDARASAYTPDFVRVRIFALTGTHMHGLYHICFAIMV
jgi:hypothetical protein